MVAVTSFSKVCVFSENDPSHDNDIIIITISRYQCLSTLETVFKSYRFQLKRSLFLIVSFRCKVKTQRKVCGFDGNDMKTYSYKPGLRGNRL